MRIPKILRNPIVSATIGGLAALAIYHVIRPHLGPFGFASKDSNKTTPLSAPSDSQVEKYVKQHHIGNPNKDIYDVEPGTGKHKGDIEITDYYPISPPSHRGRSHPNNIYDVGVGGISESQCCAYLQQMMSQQQQ